MNFSAVKPFQSAQKALYPLIPMNRHLVISVTIPLLFLTLFSPTAQAAKSPFTQSATLQASTWACTLQSYAGKFTATILWGKGSLTCTAPMESVNIQVTAIRCQPILWGCLWFEQGAMGSCSLPGLIANQRLWCPGSGSYRWSAGIAKGKRYGVRVSATTIAADGATAAGAADFDVQF